MAKDVVDGHRPLRSSRVRQHQFSRDVTDRPEMGDRLAVGHHLHAVVDRHEPALGFNAELVQVEVAAAWDPTGGHQNSIHLKGLHRLAGLHVDQFNLNRSPRFDRLGQNP